MKQISLAVTIVLAFCVIGSARAKAAEPVVTSIGVDGAQTLTVGDHFRIVIKIEADAGTNMTLPPASLPQTMTLIGAPTMSSKDKSSGRIEITLTAEAAAFFVGDAQVPPLSIAFRDRSGVSGQILTPPLRLSIASTVSERAG